jgi:hypothetical protein
MHVVVCQEDDIYAGMCQVDGIDAGMCQEDGMYVSGRWYVCVRKMVCMCQEDGMFANACAPCI